MRGLTVFVIHAYTATVEAISNETRKVLRKPLNFFYQICLTWSRLQWSFLLLLWNTTCLWETTKSSHLLILCRFQSTVEPLWKARNVTKVAQFGPFRCTILYKSCLFCPSRQTGHLFWKVTILGSLYWGVPSVHENRRTCQTFLMARAKCPMRDFINFNRIYKAQRTIVWWTMKVFICNWTCMHINRNITRYIEWKQFCKNKVCGPFSREFPVLSLHH